MITIKLDPQKVAYTNYLMFISSKLWMIPTERGNHPGVEFQCSICRCANLAAIWVVLLTAQEIGGSCWHKDIALDDNEHLFFAIK